jgi:hypothetical protein
MTKFLAVAAIAFAAFATFGYSTPAHAVQCTAVDQFGRAYTSRPSRSFHRAQDRAIRTCQYYTRGGYCRIVNCG